MFLKENTLLHGTYRIVRFINWAGFCCVYEAEHLMLQKKVSITEFFVGDICYRDEVTAKIAVVVSKSGDWERIRQKFIEEVRALCSVRYSGIVSVSDLFEENGTVYYVMDYIGCSVESMIDSAWPLPEDRAVDYIRQVSDILKYIHSDNKLHLAIRPGNIYLEHNGTITIDHVRLEGTERMYDEFFYENIDPEAPTPTTPPYEPPELCSGRSGYRGPSTDIYSLGATLYKMLTGITPLDALTRIGEAMTPIPVYISESVREAVTAAMELDWRKRPQTIEDFLMLLCE